MTMNETLVSVFDDYLSFEFMVVTTILHCNWKSCHCIPQCTVSAPYNYDIFIYNYHPK